MSNEVKWIKIVVDVFDDEKIRLIESMPEGDTLVIIWFKLLCLAGKQNDSGVLILRDNFPFTDEMFSVIFRRPLNTVRLALKTFESYGMIEVVNGAVAIPNWNKHQNLSGAEAAKEATKNRVRRFRERQKLIAGDKSVEGTDGETPLPQCGGNDAPTEPDAPADPACDKDALYHLLLNDGTSYGVSQEEVEKFSKIYPNVDVHQQFRNMVGWCDTNPTKRKTRKGIRRFINNWLMNQQDSGRSFRANTTQPYGQPTVRVTQQVPPSDENPFRRS